MKIQKSKELFLRFYAVANLVLIMIVLVVMTLFVRQRLEYRNRFLAADGYMNLSQTTLFEEPIYLNGQWEAFEGVVCNNSEEVNRLGETSKRVQFPIGPITQAKTSATYRLRFSLPKGGHDGLVLYIPTFERSADIYLNGVKQEYIEDGKEWLSYSTLQSIVPLKDISEERSWQELVITADFVNQPTTLYKRPVVIGTMKNVSDLALFSSANEMFLVGILILILVNGFIFMVFCPNHKVISAMTLFDSMILGRSAFAMSYVIAFTKGIFTSLQISDRMSYSITLAFLMLGGVFGCLLSGELYDPERRAPRWLIKPIPWIYAIFMVVFPLWPQFFEKYGQILLVITYLMTFIGVFVQYRVSWEFKEKRAYNFFQLIKTGYIGLLIFLDILLWNTSIDFMLIFYLYGVFFIMHMIVRLYDNNKSYREVEILNMGLESTVEQRTRELSEANRILSELSTRDPLTKIYNRLYFEKAVERAFDQYNKNGVSLHLCIFDLDFFKTINDTYGHDAGDEQLKSISTMVDGLTGEDATFARIGGEEFILLFEGKTSEEVGECVNKVREMIEQDSIKNPKHTTASFGLAKVDPGDTVKILMKKADTALYEAKEKGRNCVVFQKSE